MTIRNKNTKFNNLMYLLPIEIGNKIFNYLMPSKGDHKKKMKLLLLEIPIKYEYFWIIRSLKWIAEMRERNKII